MNGVDARPSNGGQTYSHMLRQIALDYAGLPDARTLTVSEIVFFYNGIRHEVKKASAPKAARG